MDRRQRRQAFRTRAARTGRGRAAETPDVYAEMDRLLDDRQITELARIVAMHACRRGMTIRTARLGGTGTGLNEKRRTVGGDVFHRQVRYGKGKQRRRHTIEDTSHEEEKFSISLKYTWRVTVWPYSTEPAEEPVSCEQIHANQASCATCSRRHR